MTSSNYFYHKVDSRNFPYLYQYSKYYGLKFVRDFYKSKIKILKLKYKKKLNSRSQTKKGRNIFYVIHPILKHISILA